MQLLALLLVPAFMGLVTSQLQQQQGHNFPDMGRAPGGSSGSRRVGSFPVAPQSGPQLQQQQGHNFPDMGRAPGGSSGSKRVDPFPVYPQSGPQMNNVNHMNAGALPQPGGSSGRRIPDFSPVAPGPVSNNVNHVQAGSVPPPGGSSRQTDPPNAPVQKGMFDRVNMVNAGGAPPPGQNSGEFVDYGYGYGGAANNAPAAGRGGNGNNQVAYGRGAGGRSGNGGPAYAAGPFSDNAGAAAPLGGATINDFTQQEAGKAEHVSKGAGMGSTVAGVVVAVLVLVGIVGVAAVFLVRQRQTRMTLSSV